MHQFVAVDVFNFIGGADHQAARSKVIKEIKSVVKINAFQQEVGYQHARKILFGFVVQKFLVNVGDVLVALQQDGVFAPFVVDFVALFRGDNALNNVGIALRMYGLLIGLQGQNQVNFRRGDVIADMRQVIGLYAVQKHQERQNAVIGFAFGVRQFAVGALVVK